MKKLILALLVAAPFAALAQSYPGPTFKSVTITNSFSAPGLVTLPSLAAQAANTVIANATGSSASPTAITMPSCNASNAALQWTSGTGVGCNTGIVPSSGGNYTGALGISASNGHLNINDSSGTGSAYIVYQDNAATAWRLLSNSSTGNFSLDRYVSGSFADSPIQVTGSTGAITMPDALTVNGTISGTGFSNYLASPPAIGGTAANVGTFTTANASKFVGTAAGTYTDTAMSTPFVGLSGGLSPNTEFTTEQGTHYDAEGFTGGVAVPNTSTIWQASGIAGYVNNASTTTNAVGGYFSARSLAANTKNWSINTVVDDGGFASTILGMEMDVGVKNVSSTVNGIAVTGAFGNLSPASSTGIQVGTLYPTNTGMWQQAFLTTDGSTNYAFSVGAKGNTANSDGQTIILNTYDQTATRQTATLEATHGTSSANLNIVLAGGGQLFVNGNERVTGVIIPSTTGGITGTTLADNANAGAIGEYATATTTGTSAASGTTVNATSVSLSAGDWDVSCNAQFAPASGTTPTQIAVSVNTTSASLGGASNGLTYLNETFAAGPTNQYANSGTVRINVSSTTTAYCPAQISYSSGSATVTGSIRARRVR
ncbi:hypothetical protein ACRS8P_29245 [Burkholderia cenocepacia]